MHFLFARSPLSHDHDDHLLIDAVCCWICLPYNNKTKKLFFFVAFPFAFPLLATVLIHQALFPESVSFSKAIQPLF